VERMRTAGVPAHKIVIGVPFYARGWTGVPPINNGLYQSATGPAAGFEDGAERYARIVNSKAPRLRHPVTRQLWTYENGNFWSYDDPIVIAEKAAYVRQHKLGGIMSWALDQDDADFALSKAMALAR
jgi:chitinase